MLVYRLLIGVFVFNLFFDSIGVIAQESSDFNKIGIEPSYEIYLRIPQIKKQKIYDLTKFSSIDRSRSTGRDLFLYLDAKNLVKIDQLGVEYQIQIPPSKLLIPQMANSIQDLSSWDVYPTYSQYLQQMQDFAINFPSIFRLDTIGKTVENRLIISGKISDNVELSENEPRFFYTSSIHGDEVTGYVLMLRLIDYLLSNYSTSNEIKALVDSMEIYINPLANPDGTYRAGDNNIYGATRFNANNVDLNRNFPDPDDGQNPDGNATQKETQAMIDYMNSKNFSMAVNFHGGSEVVNYPWDTYYKRHADDLWFQHISRVYADTVHLYSTDYLNSFNNGITNGYDWYSISGGRQDFSNYFAQCKEVTIEISNTKMPEAQLLPNFWNYNYRSFLAYMREAMYGFRGYVLDSETNDPILADIEILNYDFDHSFVKCNKNGFYTRPLLPGVYDIVASAEGYYSDTIYNISLNQKESISLNFELDKSSLAIQDIQSGIYYYPNPATNYIKIVSDSQLINNVEIYNLQGKLIKRENYNQMEIVFDLSNCSSGVYLISVYTNNSIFRDKIIKN